MMNRRTFLQRVGAAGAVIGFPTIIPSSVLGETAPSKRITLGFIGMGSQGMYANLSAFLGYPDAKVVAVCDAYMERANKARLTVDERYGTTDCKAYQDFRAIIQDPAIDAVVISTPDHWHVPMSLMALEAGKNVFSEKPTLNIQEGRVLADACAKHGAVFQAGIEDRSQIHFHKMVEWVKNGAIGKLERVEVKLPSGQTFPLESPAPPPSDLDWNLWQGPAAFHEYTPRRTGAWQWRGINLYSKGAILDMGTHLGDTAQLAINDPDVCPVTVSGTGEIPEGQQTNVPVKFDLTYRYGNGVEMHLQNGPRGGWNEQSCFLEFQGVTGWIRRKTWSAGIEASDPKILRKRYEPDTSKHPPLPPREQRNFLDCVKSRASTTYPALDMHHMSTMLHMGVICIQLGRKLQWDTKTEAFVKDDEANTMCKSPIARDWAKES
jgi:predicted dehydrogenase